MSTTPCEIILHPKATHDDILFDCGFSGAIPFNWEPSDKGAETAESAEPFLTPIAAAGVSRKIQSDEVIPHAVHQCEWNTPARKIPSLPVVLSFVKIFASCRLMTSRSILCQVR